MIQCEHCEREFKTGAAVAMHMRWVNGWVHPMKGKKLIGQRLQDQQAHVKIAQLSSPSGKCVGERVKLQCARKECSQNFSCTKSQSKLRKYCSKSCQGFDRPRQPLTQKQKKAISVAQKKRYAANPESNPFYGRTPTNYQGWGHGGFSETLGFHVRSTWERDYLIALKENNVEFEYEPQRYDLGQGRGTYLPDIRLDGRDIFVEITGWDKPGKEQKRLLFQKVYGWPLYVEKRRPSNETIKDFVMKCKELISAE